MNVDRFGRKMDNGRPQWDGKKLDRPMVRSNFYAILCRAYTGNTDLVDGAIPTLSGDVAHLSAVGHCPHQGCAGAMKIASAMEWKGRHQIRVYWLQCERHPSDPSHGYGSASPHRSYRSYRRNARMNEDDSRETPDLPTPDTTPDPTPTPPKHQQTPMPDLGPGVVSHENLPKLFGLAVDGGCRAFLLEGPAGSGKTSMAPQLQKALSIHWAEDFGLAMVSGNAETESAQLGVFKSPHDGSEKLSPLMRAATDTKPHVIVIDEADAIQPGNLLALNAPVAQRCVVLDGISLQIHPKTVFLLTANASSGANRIYTGRFPMDGAVKSRFLPIFCDYSPAIDRSVCQDPEILHEVSALRKRVNNDPTLARQFGAIVGTRLLIQACQVSKAFGLSGRPAVIETLRLGNSPESLASLGY